MEEENGKVGLSWLGLKEVNNLLSDTELNIGERNVLKRQRELFLEEMKQEVLHSESPMDTIKVILRISDEQELDVEMVDLGIISVRILFARAKKHLSTDEIELVGKVLKRMYPDDKGLRNEPWETMLFENAKKSFPPDAGKMVEAVTEAGIDKEEYIKEVLTPMILWLTHNATEEDLTSAVLSRGNLLTDIDKFYGFDNLDREQKERLLTAVDILLARWSKEYGPQYLEKVCQVYEWLNKKGVDIDRRVEIVEIRERYRRKVPAWGQIGDAISCRLCEMKIRGIAKKIKII